MRHDYRSTSLCTASQSVLIIAFRVPDSLTNNQTGVRVYVQQ